VNIQVEEPSAAPGTSQHDKWEKYRVYKRGECIEWDIKGKCIQTYEPLQVSDCDKDGCVVSRNGFSVGSISREEITKAQWIPVK
jgi:hypothetical protein